MGMHGRPRSVTHGADNAASGGNAGGGAASQGGGGEIVSMGGVNVNPGGGLCGAWSVMVVGPAIAALW